MIEFKIEGKRQEEIINYENENFKMYTNIMNRYFGLFKKRGYTLKVDMRWKNFYDKTWSVERLPMQAGYECHIFCIVEKNGKEVVVKSTYGGETVYYPLVSDWEINFIYRRFNRLKVRYSPVTDGVVDELDDLLLQLNDVVNDIT